MSWNYELGAARPARCAACASTRPCSATTTRTRSSPLRSRAEWGPRSRTAARRSTRGSSSGPGSTAAPSPAPPQRLPARRLHLALPSPASRAPASATCRAPRSVSVSGNRLPYAPETLLTARPRLLPPAGLTAQLEAVHVGEQFTDDLNSVGRHRRRPARPHPRPHDLQRRRELGPAAGHALRRPPRTCLTSSTSSTAPAA